MNEKTPHSSTALNTLAETAKRLSDKVSAISKAVDMLHQNRIQLEGKIEDAQKRIQNILSRLPEQGDSRQMNLLGEASVASSVSTSNQDDDHEPTTH